MKHRTPPIVSLLLCLLLSGCVAQTTSISHNTLKGDNSLTPAMKNSVDLPSSGFTTLSDLTDRFSRDLSVTETQRRIYLDRANIRDVSTRDVANFSSYLQQELEASLSQHGFQLEIMPDEAELLLGATFQKYGNQLKIFFKYHTLDHSIHKTSDYGIERDRLPADSLKENLHSKAYQLAANIIDDDLERRIYIKPIESSACKCVGPFSRSFTTFVKGDIVKLHRQVEVVDEKPVKAKLSDTRSLNKKAKEVKNLDTSDALFADADSVLEGEYVVNGDQVMISLLLKDLAGHVINTANVDIDRDVIKIPLEDKKVAKLADLVDRKTEDNGKKINISTSRSGDYPVYHNGETILFYVQTKEPLYTYLYAIDSKGAVTPLYPGEGKNGRNRIYPGSLITIPTPDDDYELVVEPPFGMDAVKVFASRVQLPLPQFSVHTTTRSYSRGIRAIGKKRKQAQHQLAAQSTINPGDLVDYYRGLGKKFGITVYEDSLVVETMR